MGRKQEILREVLYTIWRYYRRNSTEEDESKHRNALIKTSDNTATIRTEYYPNMDLNLTAVGRVLVHCLSTYGQLPLLDVLNNVADMEFVVL
jgi:hypothetical protein